MRAALAIKGGSDLQRAGRALSALRYVRRYGAYVRTRRANYTRQRPIASAPELTERAVAREDRAELSCPNDLRSVFRNLRRSPRPGIPGMYRRSIPGLRRSQPRRPPENTALVDPAAPYRTHVHGRAGHRDPASSRALRTP